MRLLILLFHDAHEPRNPDAAYQAALREIETLPENVGNVLRARDRGETYDEIAESLGLRRERVRQLEAKGLRLLRHPRRGLWEL